MSGLIDRLFPKKIVVEPERPSRAFRRAALAMKPGERKQKALESALAKAKRKKARGYKNDHVRKREVYKAGMDKGVDITLTAMKRTMAKHQKRKWLPRIWARAKALGHATSIEARRTP